MVIDLALQYLKGDEKMWFSRTMDDETTKFFITLGYKVDWDRDKRGRWYEISDEEHMIVQIDCGVPLEHLIEDMGCWAKGLPTVSGSSYEIRTPDVLNEQFKKLCLAAFTKFSEDRTV